MRILTVKIANVTNDYLTYDKIRMLCSGDGLPEYLEANAGEINRN